MLSKVIKGAILGGLVVFVWGVVSWGLLPWHKSSIRSFKNENEVKTVIMRNAPEEGIYCFPHELNKAQGQKKPQPFIFAAVKPDGAEMGTANFVKGFITQLVAAAIVTLLLLKSQCHRYWTKVAFVTLIGLFAAIVGYVPAWNWAGFPATYIIINMLDMTFAWFLAGLALAASVCCSSYGGGGCCSKENNQGTPPRSGGCCGR